MTTAVAVTAAVKPTASTARHLKYLFSKDSSINVFFFSIWFCPLLTMLEMAAICHAFNSLASEEWNDLFINGLQLMCNVYTKPIPSMRSAATVWFMNWHKHSTSITGRFARFWCNVECTASMLIVQSRAFGARTYTHQMGANDSAASTAYATDHIRAKIYCLTENIYYDLPQQYWILAIVCPMSNDADVASVAIVIWKNH